MLSYATALAAVASIATAQNFSTWSPPGQGDVRSPCPALNTLANHGILPHNGKGYSLKLLIPAFEYGMNVGADFTSVIGAAGILSVPDDLLATSFDLDDLDEHNFPIEHDASLSRADYYEDNGDNYSFNQSIFNTVLAYYHGMASTSIPVAAKAKLNRVVTENARDPKFTYTAQQFILSYGESALYLSVMGDPVTGVAPLDYVQIFFEEERLPYAEGWRPPTTQTNLLTLGAMILQLVTEAGDLLPQGLNITTNTLKLAFGGYDPITGVLAHIL